jgi:hypothetical protein
MNSHLTGVPRRPSAYADDISSTQVDEQPTALKARLPVACQVQPQNFNAHPFRSVDSSWPVMYVTGQHPSSPPPTSPFGNKSPPYPRRAWHSRLIQKQQNNLLQKSNVCRCHALFDLKREGAYTGNSSCARHARMLPPYPPRSGGGALAWRVAGAVRRVRRGVSGIQIATDPSAGFPLMARGNDKSSTLRKVSG